MIPIDTIVVPQGAEYQAVNRGLKRAKADLRVIPIPIGIKSITQIVASYGEELAMAQNILLSGLCGSLSQDYSIGDIALYGNCRNIKNQQVNLDSALTTTIAQKLAVNLVTGLTSDRLICQTREKLELSQAYPVSVLDMEGYDYIQELQQRQINVAMLRVVSDDLTGDIPNLSQAIDCQGKIKPMKIAIAFLKQPIAAMRLIHGSLTGLKILEQVIYQLTISLVDT